jgi:hypothetical protein
MSTSNTVVPLRFVIEVLRYIDPNTYRFAVWVEPSELDSKYDVNGIEIPSTHLFGRRYREINRQQVGEERAKEVRDCMPDIGYVRWAWNEIPEEMIPVVRGFCPIEFHQGMRDNNPEITDGICVWVLTDTEVLDA